MGASEFLCVCVSYLVCLFVSASASVSASVCGVCVLSAIQAKAYVARPPANTTMPAAYAAARWLRPRDRRCHTCDTVTELDEKRAIESSGARQDVTVAVVLSGS